VTRVIIKVERIGSTGWLTPATDTRLPDPL